MNAHARGLCGLERWTVRTLQDRPTLLPAQTTTIAFLTSRPALANLIGSPLESAHPPVVAARTDLTGEQAEGPEILLVSPVAVANRETAFSASTLVTHSGKMSSLLEPCLPQKMQMSSRLLSHRDTRQASPRVPLNASVPWSA